MGMTSPKNPIVGTENHDQTRILKCLNLGEVANHLQIRIRSLILPAKSSGMIIHDVIAVILIAMEISVVVVVHVGGVRPVQMASLVVVRGQTASETGVLVEVKPNVTPVMAGGSNAAIEGVRLRGGIDLGRTAPHGTVGAGHRIRDSGEADTPHMLGLRPGIVPRLMRT